MAQAHHSEPITEVISAVFRDEYARVIGALVRLTRDLDLAEECAQDAFVQALDHWVKQGIPPNPGAWLTVVARNRALDRLRRVANERNKLEEVA